MAKKKKRWSLKKILLTAFLAVVASLLLFTVYFFISLPEVAHLKDQNPPTTAMMEQRQIEARKKGKTLNIRQKWVSFNQIPQLLKDTVRVSEDGAFYQHNGIDYYELKESIKRNIRDGKKARGGSTITQQLAKNLFLSTQKSYYRKLREFFIAKRLENHLTKDRIFHLYLNVIEFGPGIFGVQAASLHYFKKPVQMLNLPEIVRLASVMPRPLKITPLANTRYMKWRIKLLLDRLKKYRIITSTDYNQARITLARN